MIKYVQNFIEQNNLSGKTILAGFSGGVDSSVLLDILSKTKNINLIAIHLNHNWRGEESKRDEEFARAFAQKRGVKFFSSTLDDSVKKTETSAREARYNFFEACKNKFGADAVFLAHNKNDNAETLIYRLIKGTGSLGLNSISKIRDFYFRPLLDFSREEIELYAKENSLEFILDSSNLNVKYKRNLIRQKILPEMQKINPKVINSITNLILVNKMTQKIVDFAYSEALEKIKIENYILRDEFLKLPLELRYEIVNRQLKGVLKNRDYKSIDEIVSFIENNSSSKMSVNKEYFLKIYNNKIYLTKFENPKNNKEAPLVMGENKFLCHTIILEESSVPDKFPQNTDEVQYAKLDKNKNYVIRTRRQGDKIQPFSSSSLEKLKTFFIKKKVPYELRDKIPLIALDDEVVYVSGFGISEKLRVAKNDKNCYKITLKKEN